MKFLFTYQRDTKGVYKPAELAQSNA
jgi:hypothetical protein